jgi:cysteine desulfurase/selenocysteine lyase
LAPSTPPIDPALFPVRRRWVYLDHAGTGPLPTPVVEAVRRGLDALAGDGGLASVVDVEAVRARAARLMGVEPEGLAFVKNTTEALGFVATGLRLRPGDRVVVPAREFPSVAIPWLALRRRGIVVDSVKPHGPAGELSLAAFDAVIRAGPPPKLIVASWVQYWSGWRVDLEGLARLAHEAGALLCIDAIQGLGVVPAEFGRYGVDFAAAGSHKWLLAPAGAGLLYVRPSCLELLDPPEPGWASLATRGQWDVVEPVFDQSARRFEGGSLDALALSGLASSLRLLEDAGIEQVFAHVGRLHQRARAALEGLGSGVVVTSSADPAHASGILTVRIEGVDAEDAVQLLRDRGIVVAPRGGALRISPHGWVTGDEIDRLVDEIGRLLSRRA